MNMLAASFQPQDVGGYSSFLPGTSHPSPQELQQHNSSPPSSKAISVAHLRSESISGSEAEGDAAGGGAKKRGSKRVRTEKLVAQNCAAQRRYRERKKEQEQELTKRVAELTAERDDALRWAEEAEQRLQEQVGGGAIVQHVRPVTEKDILDDILGQGQENLDSLGLLSPINRSYESQWTNQKIMEARGTAAPDLRLATSSTCGFTYGLTDVTGYNIRADPKLQVLVETLQQLDESVEIAGKDLKLLWANQSFLDINGYTFDEVVGRKPRDLVRSELTPHSFWEGLSRDISNGKTFKGQMYRKRKDRRDYLCQVKAFRVRHDVDSCFFVMIAMPIVMADGLPVNACPCSSFF